MNIHIFFWYSKEKLRLNIIKQVNNIDQTMYFDPFPLSYPQIQNYFLMQNSLVGLSYPYQGEVLTQNAFSGNILYFYYEPLTAQNRPNMCQAPEWQAMPLIEQEIKADSEANSRSSDDRVSQNSTARNDTKNIPKNYGKAILTFIQKSPKSRKLAAEMGIPFSDFMMLIRRTKKKVNSIEGLRKMWGSENLQHPIRKCIRILSYDFMRKHCLRYIFHSKVRNYGTHIKYRKRLIEGIENPVAFRHIKDY